MRVEYRQAMEKDVVDERAGLVDSPRFPGYHGMCGRRMASVFIFGRNFNEDGLVAVDRDEVKRIARLAALSLTDEEIDRYQGDLNAILAYIAQIQTVDLEDSQLPAEPDRVDSALRDDVVCPGLTREEALANAPDTDGEHFRVPPAIPLGSDPSR